MVDGPYSFLRVACRACWPEVEAKENKEAVMLELEQLANYKAELHSSCDFVTWACLPSPGSAQYHTGNTFG